jgi:RNA polymerase sigma-70 factor (sigma-E family)
MDQQLADYIGARWPALVRYATVVSGDAADGEELAQAVLVKVASRWWLIRDRDHLDAYVRTAIVRSHINQATRLRRRELRTAEPPSPIVADHTDATGRALDIRRALSALPPRQRAVLALRYLDDMTEAQTADVMGCSVGTVKSQTSKALAKLREAFPDLNEQADLSDREVRP